MSDPFFGVGKLDGDLDGFPPQKTVVINASPDVGNEVFGYQISHANLSNDKKVLLFLNRMSPAAYLAEMKEYNLPANDNLKIIDAYSNITGIKSQPTKNIVAVDNPYNKEEISKKLSAELDAGYDLVIFDSLSLFSDIFDIDFMFSIIDLVNSKIKDSKLSSVMLFTDWGYGEDVVSRLYKSANATIEVKGIEKRVIFGQYFAVVKCDWIEKSMPRTALFKAVKPGGIKIYIPKILVTGPTDAGKSSFIHSASKTAVSVDKLGGTIALDHGHIDFDGYSADLFGTPGQERFDPLLELLGGEAIGVLLVVDSTKPDQFPRALEMLRKTETFGLPIVVVANKADLNGALETDDIRKRLHLEDSVPVIKTVAEDPSSIDPNQPTKLKSEGVDSALRSLFSQLT